VEVLYRKLFLKDLKKLKKQPVYKKVFNLAFTVLPEVKTLRDIAGVKSMKGHSKRYCIRIGKYRVGIEIHNNTVELMRVLHRREFYRYFP